MDELKPYTFNVKAWRVRNGYTTPEWVMYRDNIGFYAICACVASFCAGAWTVATIYRYGWGV